MILTKKQIFQMTIPALLEQALLQMVLALNLIFVSSAGASTVSGVSFVDQITILISCTFAVAGIGVSVVVAQLTGQGNEEGVQKVIRQAVLIGLIFSFFAFLLGFFFNRPAIGWLMNGSESSVLQNASLYFKLSAVSYPFLMLYQVLIYVLRGRGQTKATMFITLIQTIVGMVLAYVLITVMQMGVFGAGMALIVSRMIGAAFSFIFVRKLDLLPRIQLSDLKIDLIVQKSIFRIGLTPGIEAGIMGMTKVAIMALVAAKASTDQMAAVGPAQIGIDLLALFPLALCYVCPTAIGFAKASLGKKELIRYAVHLLLISIAASFASHMLLGALATWYANLFGLSVETTDTIIKIIQLGMWMQIVPWVFSYIIPPMMRAAGDSVFASVCSAASVLLVRYPLAYYFCVVRGMGAYGLYLAMFFDFLVKGVITLIYFLWGRWADRKKIEIPARAS